MTALDTPRPSIAGRPGFSADESKAFAKAIATDLFRFLDSFGHSISPDAVALLDRWYDKFAHKMERDPLFWQTVARKD